MSTFKQQHRRASSTNSPTPSSSSSSGISSSSNVNYNTYSSTSTNNSTANSGSNCINLNNLTQSILTSFSSVNRHNALLLPPGHLQHQSYRRSFESSWNSHHAPHYLHSNNSFPQQQANHDPAGVALPTLHSYDEDWPFRSTSLSPRSLSPPPLPFAGGSLSASSPLFPSNTSPSLSPLLGPSSPQLAPSSPLLASAPNPQSHISHLPHVSSRPAHVRRSTSASNVNFCCSQPPPTSHSNHQQQSHQLIPHHPYFSYQTQNTLQSTQEPEHFLERDWALWFDTGLVKGQTQSQYESSVRDIGVFSSIEDFWRYWNHVFEGRKFPEGSHLRVFKNGVKPTWEDPANAGGGRWIIASPKHLTNVTATSLVLSVIGEQLPHSNELCGVVVGIRSTADIIYLWNSKVDPQVVTLTTDKIRSLLLSIAEYNWSVKYTVHKEAVSMNERIRAAESPSLSLSPASPLLPSSSPILSPSSSSSNIAQTDLPLNFRLEHAADPIVLKWGWGDMAEAGFLSEAITAKEEREEFLVAIGVWKQRLGAANFEKGAIPSPFHFAHHSQPPQLSHVHYGHTSQHHSGHQFPSQAGKNALSQGKTSPDTSKEILLPVTCFPPKQPGVHRRAHSQDVSQASPGTTSPPSEVPKVELSPKLKALLSMPYQPHYGKITMLHRRSFSADVPVSHEAEVPHSVGSSHLLESQQITVEPCKDTSYLPISIPENNGTDYTPIPLNADPSDSIISLSALPLSNTTQLDSHSSASSLRKTKTESVGVKSSPPLLSTQKPRSSHDDPHHTTSPQAPLQTPQTNDLSPQLASPPPNTKSETIQSEMFTQKQQLHVVLIHKQPKPTPTSAPAPIPTTTASTTPAISLAPPPVQIPKPMPSPAPLPTPAAPQPSPQAASPSSAAAVPQSIPAAQKSVNMPVSTQKPTSRANSQVSVSLKSASDTKPKVLPKSTTGQTISTTTTSTAASTTITTTTTSVVTVTPPSTASTAPSLPVALCPLSPRKSKLATPPISPKLCPTPPLSPHKLPPTPPLSPHKSTPPTPHKEKPETTSVSVDASPITKSTDVSTKAKQSSPPTAHKPKQESATAQTQTKSGKATAAATTTATTTTSTTTSTTATTSTASNRKPSTKQPAPIHNKAKSGKSGSSNQVPNTITISFFHLVAILIVIICVVVVYVTWL
ncbi:digestive organ expansion factor [Pelomyxa schiedti]|nr:digestive organ expansion factor [Pelomyxa schiedti]